MSTTSAAAAAKPKAAVRRGPRKVRLDTTKIVAAGLEVAEETGSDTFSPKLLGDKPVSYTHLDVYKRQRTVPSARRLSLQSCSATIWASTGTG